MMIYKTINKKIEDITDKGQVVIAVNAIGIEDDDGDISLPGSFDKTIQNNFNRLKWFLNHDTSILLGVPVSGKEECGLIKMTSQFNMKKQISRDTYEDYKLYAEYGKSLEHSVGVKAIRRNPANAKEVEEWEMWEYSTLTNWGANPVTPLLDIKSMDKSAAEDHIKFLGKALAGKFSEERLKKLEESVLMIRKAVIGDVIVKCPYCGLVYDYNSVPEETLSNRIAEAVDKYVGWLADDVAYQEVQKLEGIIREEVMNIIESRKSLDLVMRYTRCPKCYNKVYPDNVLISDSLKSSKINIKNLISKL